MLYKRRGVTKVFATILNIQSPVFRGVAKAVSVFGEIVQLHAVTIFVIGLIIAGAASSGLFLRHTENNIEKLWYPTDQSSYNNLEQETKLFGDPPRASYFLATSLNNQNILNKTILQALWQSHVQVVTNITSKKGFQYADACYGYYAGGPCMFSNIFALWNYNYTLFMGDPYPIQARVTVALPMLGALVGGIVMNGSTVVGATSLLFSYYVSSDPSEINNPNVTNDDVLSWEAVFLKYFYAQPNPTLVTYTALSERSYEDEINATIKIDEPLVYVLVGVSLLLMVFSLGKRNFVESKVVVGILGIGVLVLTFFFSLGLSSYFQIPHSSISLLCLFVILTIGINHLLLVTDAFHFIGEFSPAIQTVGVSILLGSIAGAVGLVVTALTTTIPALYYFCYLSAVVMLGIMLLQALIYYPVLLVNRKREESGRVDCLPCIKTSGPKPFENSSNGIAAAFFGSESLLRRFIKAYYAPFILNNLVKFVVIILFFAAVAVAAIYISKIPAGDEFETQIRGSSQLAKFANTIKREFGALITTLTIVIADEDVDYSNATVQQHLREVYMQYATLPDVIPPVYSWYEGFATWQSQNNLTTDFTTQVRQFLLTNSPQYTRDIVFNTNGTSILATRMRTNVLDRSPDVSVHNQSEAMDAIGNILKAKFPKDSFVYATPFLTTQRDSDILNRVVINLACGAVAVFLILLFFIPMILAFLVSLCIIMIDVLLLGVMKAADLSLIATPLIILAFSIAPILDYIIHIVIAFVRHMDKERNSRRAVIASLVDITPSIFNSGVIILIGLIALGFSETWNFKAFFEMTFALVVFGVAFQMMFIPAVLDTLPIIFSTAHPPSLSELDDEFSLLKSGPN